MEESILSRIENMWIRSETLWEQSFENQDDFLSTILYSAWLGSNFVSMVDALPDELMIACLNNDFISPEQALLISSHKSDDDERDRSLSEVLKFLAKRNFTEQLLDYLELIRSEYQREQLIEFFAKRLSGNSKTLILFGR